MMSNLTQMINFLTDSDKETTSIPTKNWERDNCVDIVQENQMANQHDISLLTISSIQNMN
jgi:hypothetical protein